MSKILSAASLATLVLLAGCKTGYNRTYNKNKDPDPPECAKLPNDSGHNNEAKRVFDMLAGLTCSETTYDGYVMGQNAGAGNQLVTSSSNRSYAKLITAVDTATSHTPGLVTIDYEDERIFTEEELLDANEQLKDHWDEGGLVGISWTPLSPWVDAPGEDEPSTTLYSNAGDVDLAELLNSNSDVHKAWRERLDVIAAALKDLQDKGVAVLWRPLPEMNKNIYWWGTDASNRTGTTSNKLYTDLWKDMHTYLTEDKDLHNLLWVYSPGESPASTANREKDVKWAYPGDEYADIVAGIARNDSLQIKDYDDLVELGRPVGMAEYTPTPREMGGTYSAEKGKFDAQGYVDRLNGSYKAVSYWVSKHTYEYVDMNGETKTSFMALIDSNFLKKLADNKLVLSVERIKEEELRD